MCVDCVSTSPQTVDPMTGLHLGANHVGEIWARGPQIMKGYYKNPDATVQTIDNNGFLHTGLSLSFLRYIKLQ